MIDRQHGKMVVECDGCGEVLETGTAYWNEANATIHAEGWRAEKVGGDWCNYCAACWPNRGARLAL